MAQQLVCDVYNDCDDSLSDRNKQRCTTLTYISCSCNIVKYFR